MSAESGHFHRRSLRLKGYDYRQAGAYFVTLVTIDRECIFGELKNGIVVLSSIGYLVSALWQALPSHFSMAIGDWVVMPNHLHGIIILQDGDNGDDGDGNGDGNGVGDCIGDGDGRGEASGNDIRGSKARYFPDASPLRAPRVKWENSDPQSPHPNGTESGSLGAIIQNYKSITTWRVNGLRPTAPGESLWQRNYYEHIIRSAEEWERISRYIIANPINWAEDSERPASTVK